MEMLACNKRCQRVWLTTLCYTTGPLSYLSDAQ